MGEVPYGAIFFLVWLVGLFPAGLIGAYVEGRRNDDTSVGLAMAFFVVVWPMFVVVGAFALVTSPIWWPAQLLLSKAHRAGRRAAERSTE